ncbi:MAG: zinc dependent phospholipase C family protein [Clostridia bacterium]|nr:zinc dependent phospholipase C family protein [Clostridia bacterium]
MAGVLASKTIWTAARALLKVVGPVQKLVIKTGQTHNFCNQQAGIILEEDGRPEVAGIMKLYLPELNRGVHWADASWKSSGHFYDPQTKKGYGHWSDGSQECRLYYSLAAKHWRRDEPSKAMFYLGAAVHLVQDLCVPHHARGLLFDGHQEYENWAEAHCREFAVDKGGNYRTSANSEGWVVANAAISSDLLPRVNQSATESDYRKATAVLLPLAQRTTAGFMAFFYDRVIQNTRMLAGLFPDRNPGQKAHQAQ